jgi:hypothetical protein
VRIEAQGDLSRFYDKGETRVERIRSLLSLAWRHLAGVRSDVGGVVWLVTVVGMGRSRKFERLNKFPSWAKSSLR